MKVKIRNGPTFKDKLNILKSQENVIFVSKNIYKNNIIGDIKFFIYDIDFNKIISFFNFKFFIPFLKINNNINKIEIENIIGNKEGAVKKLLSGTLILKDSNKNQIKNNIRNSEEKTSMRGAALPAPSSSEIYFFLFKLLFIN